MQRDPLRVLESTRPVAQAARWARVANDAVPAVARQLAGARIARPAWNPLHFSDGGPRTANVVLVQDALNFCFWGEPRWHVIHEGQRYNGYWALVACLRRAIEGGVPLWDAGYLAAIRRADVEAILAGEAGTRIPLMGARVRHLQEVGQVLLARWGGEFARAVEAADGSAVALIQTLVEQFSSFHDVAHYYGYEARLFKRAQILASDLAGSFGFEGLGRFHDMHALTAFADYKVPQVLRRLGLLAYAPALAERLDRLDEIPYGSDEEIEIRAATVWAVERLREELEDLGMDLAAYELDWYLWEAGQQASAEDRPYHHTRTIYY